MNKVKFQNAIQSVQRLLISKAMRGNARLLAAVLGAAFLSACGGGGSSSSNAQAAAGQTTTTTTTTTSTTTTTTVPTSSNSKNVFFVATSEVYSFVTANPPPTGLLAGTQIASVPLLDGASCVQCIAYDSTNDTLYVAGYGDVVAVFANASTAGVGAVASRLLTLQLPPSSSGTGYVNYPSLFFDNTSGTLYAEVNNGLASTGGAVLIFHNAAMLNGNAVPDQAITINNISIYSFAIDVVKSILYLSDTNNVYVFPNINSASGLQAPARTYPMQTPTAIAVDSTRDRLYVMSSSKAVAAGVQVVTQASTQFTITGSILGLSLPSASTGLYPAMSASIAVDGANDRLYAGAEQWSTGYTSLTGYVYVINQASLLTGTNGSIVGLPSGASFTTSTGLLGFAVP